MNVGCSFPRLDKTAVSYGAARNKLPSSSKFIRLELVMRDFFPSAQLNDFEVDDLSARCVAALTSTD